jgi:hypothetical protein
VATDAGQAAVVEAGIEIRLVHEAARELGLVTGRRSDNAHGHGLAHGQGLATLVQEAETALVTHDTKN